MNASSGLGIAAKPPIFTRNYVLICLATFFSSGAQFLVLTAIPSLLIELGFSSGFVGGFIGAFGLGALVVRLPVGRGVDRFGPRRFALIGAISMSAAYVLYAIISMALLWPSFGVVVPFLLLLAGLAHSLGFSTYGTAAHSSVAYTAPRARRGEAISYYGILIDAARALGAGLSLIIVLAKGYSVLLVTAAIMALLAAALASNLRKVKVSSDVTVVPSKPSKIETRVLAPALTSSTIALSGGATLAFVPLLGLERGILNPGIFFTVVSLTSIFIRMFAGRFTDRFGRIAAIVPGMLLVATGLLFVSGMSSIGALILAGLVYGIGFSTASIALQARAIDMAGPERQGTAMATYFAMVDLGVALGAMAAGQLVPIVGYSGVFALASVIPFLGLAAFLLYTWVQKARSSDSNDVHPAAVGPEIDPDGNHNDLPSSGANRSLEPPGSVEKKAGKGSDGTEVDSVTFCYRDFGLPRVNYLKGYPIYYQRLTSEASVYRMGG